MNEQLNLFAQSKKEYKINKPIRLIELFGGIGSHAKALENLGANFERWRLCEWAIPSIRAYSAIHEGWRGESGRWKEATMEDLLKRTNGVSSDYNQPLSEDGRKRLGRKALEELCGAMDACNDFCPNVSEIHPSDLSIEKEGDRKHCYILTYSFPCQDLSQAGKLAGMEKGSGTRSGLLWEVERLLGELKEAESRPDVLLMENVPGVCGYRNLKPWNEWLDRLEELGYSNYWAKVNAKDHGIPQNRLRVFMVSILGEYGYHFPKKRKLIKRLRDLLEENPDPKYNLSPRIIETMLYGDSKGFDRSDGGLSTCVTTSPFFMGKILVKNATKKGYLEAEEGDGIDCGTRMQYHRGTVQSGMSQTIKTTIDIATQSEGKLRKLTPLECMRLMGFSDKDEQSMRSIGMSDSAIYHCAGDSIVVDVLMDIFKELL